jgi:hypothetical protein
MRNQKRLTPHKHVRILIGLGVGQRPADTYSFRPDVRISHEAIYHYLYLLSRGEVKKSMISLLRRSKPNQVRKTSQDVPKGRIPDLIDIGESPQEVGGRLVPGHWEGDMIMGAGNRSAIATLVERGTNDNLSAGMQADRHERPAAPVLYEGTGFVRFLSGRPGPQLGRFQRPPSESAQLVLPESRLQRTCCIK